MLKPPNPTHLREAKLAGLVLLRRAGKQFPNDNIYECPNCAAELRLRAELVRAKLKANQTSYWECEKCKWKKYEAEADAAGLEIVSETPNSHTLFYRFKDCSHEQEIQKQSVRLNQVTCRACLDIKLQQEAERVGLKIIGSPSKLNYRLYCHLECGHTAEYVVAAVRQASKKKNVRPYRCLSCSKDALQKEAKQAGLILYGESHKVGKNKWYLYAADCGHTLERRREQIRRGEWKCNACIDAKLDVEADDADLNLIGKGKDKAFRKYQFRSCGHVKEITTANVRLKAFHCDVCFWEDKNEILQRRGVVLLGTSHTRDKYLFKFIQCGHIREIALKNAMDGSFVCHECEDTWYTQPSNVYLLQMTIASESWLKLGVAKVVETRVKQYGLPSATKVEPLSVVATQSGQHALRIESQLNQEFGQFRYSPDDMKRWHRYSGFTECYPVSLLPSLQKALEAYHVA